LLARKAGPAELYFPEGYENEYLNDSNERNFESNINYDPDPIRIQRDDDRLIEQNQIVRIRYLQPPQIRTPSPNLIYEKQATPLPPLTPIKIRQYVPISRTPTPILIRELEPPRKPSIEPKKSPQIRVLPAELPAPRTVIIERVYKPRKPQEVIVEVKFVSF
jgi:hypothetical protein